MTMAEVLERGRGELSVSAEFRVYKIYVEDINVIHLNGITTSHRECESTTKRRIINSSRKVIEL